MGWVYRKLLGLKPREAEFERRGFPALGSPHRGRLEAVGRSFIGGYNAALAAGEPGELAGALEATAPEQKGFAYEGAVMALMILDLTMPWEKGVLHLIAREAGEPLDAAATRVWAAAESLTKAGVLPTSALVVRQAHPDGWVLLSTLGGTVATGRVTIRDGRTLIVAVLGRDAG
jgi:hypothetical protein